MLAAHATLSYRVWYVTDCCDPYWWASAKYLLIYRKGHVDGARQHPGFSHMASFPTWLLGCVGYDSGAKANWLSERARRLRIYRLGPKWEKRLLYCKLCLPCPQICSLFLGILCNDQQQSDEQLPRWSQCFRTSLYIIQIRHNASHERIAG